MVDGIIIHNRPADLKTRSSIRTAKHRNSMEAELRRILQTALTLDTNLLSALLRRRTHRADSES